MTFLLLIACESSVEVGDTAADTDTGEQIDDTAPPAPETVWDEYEGLRNYLIETSYWTCEESTEDEGEELLEGDEFDQVMALCPDCGHVFENDPVESSLCYSAITLARNWRAIDLDDDGQGGILTIYVEGDAGLEEYTSMDFGFDGELADFAYTVDTWAGVVEVTGEMVFEMAVPE